MPFLNSDTWDLIFDLPALRATLDELPGYEYPEALCAALCARYELSRPQLADVRRVYNNLRPARAALGLGKWERPPVGRSGAELLQALPKLRQVLDAERGRPEHCATIIRQRRERFHLSRAEMVVVLEAHAETGSPSHRLTPEASACPLPARAA